MNLVTRRRFAFLCAAMVLLCGSFLCVQAAARDHVLQQSLIPIASANVLTPQTGTITYSGASGTIDASNIEEGYVQCKYAGDRTSVRVQITKSGGSTYTYILNTSGRYEVFPLSAGNGKYTINVFEQVVGNQYALACTATLDVTLRDSTLPFLYPNQYVNFNANSAVVKKGEELTGSSATDLEKVSNIYNYVITNITYDTQKASNPPAGYIPSVDSVLASGKGICFDYASLMAAMLRSQGIPTQVRIGYVSNGVYHAWLGVYTKETGWINGAIYFDGTSWKLMDPTFASSGNQSEDVMKFIGNGTNYNTMYLY